MLTFVALPKPFIGHIGVIQRNAIQSWLALNPRPRVVLFGDEEGVAEVVQEFGIDHVPDVERNEFGTPMLPSVFTTAEKMSRDGWMCYINCDIVLVSKFMPSIEKVIRKMQQCLVVGWCTNLDVRKPIDFSDSEWEQKMLSFMRVKGTKRGNTSDYFVYRKGMYPYYPPLILGRAYFDNWVIYEARRLKIPVVNATDTIAAIHQNHFYTAVAGEDTGNHSGEEAHRNLDIIGKKYYVYRPTEASHELTKGGKLRVLWSGYLLIRPRLDRLRRCTWSPVKRRLASAKQYLMRG